MEEIIFGENVHVRSCTFSVHVHLEHLEHLEPLFCRSHVLFGIFAVVHMWRLGRNHPAGGLRDNSGSVRRHLPEEKSVADITPEAARTAPFAKPALLQTWRIFLLIFVVISVFVLDGSWRQL